MGMTTNDLVPVVDASQVSAARFAAHAIATAAGFGTDDVHRAGLVTTELASNLVKHTPEGGKILLRSSADEDGGGLEITSIDHGPGIGDLRRAQVDGYSTAGSLGGGLGAVRRLTDAYDVYSSPGKGTAITVRIRRERPAAVPRLQVGGVGLAARGEQVSGDAWNVWSNGSVVTIALADGLGHGPEAAKAAQLAIKVLSAAHSETPAAAMQIAHQALRPTRGAAAALTAIDLAAATVRFIGVGNIACVFCEPDTTRHTVSLGGTLGHEARTFREFTYPWHHEAVAVMHSDGLTSHWSLDDYPGLRACSPALIAAVLYRDFTRGRDDVTVVVAKEAA